MDDDLFVNLGDNILIGEADGVFVGGDQDLLSESESIVGPPGPPGPAGRDGVDGVDGQSATVTVGSTTTTAPGTDAIVTNVGTNLNAILDFSIPRGAVGETGPAGADGVDGVDGSDGFSPIATVTQTEYGAAISITDSNGTTTADVVNGSQGPQGPAATIAVGTTTTGAAGTNASVTNSGTSSAAVFNFTIPRGDTGAAGADGNDGQAATIAVGTTTTGAAGTNASVTNSGTSSAAVFNFTIPRGDTGAAGADGNDGAAATITVGSTTTGAAGTSASVTNSGTSSAAILDFTIPKGQDGSIEELTSVPKFNAYYNTTYSSFPADTPIPFNTQQVNIGSFSMTGGRVTIPKSGNYMITVQLWVQNGGSRSWWRLRRNGNTIGESIISGTSYWGLTAISNIYPCTQGDIIDVIKNGSESVNLNSGSADKRTTSISIQYIG